ncbi:MAG: hypothetical protein KME46_33340 [Brasilonema angustatum HA4187-MV1]|jgi:hypothetical protein|nr:hypothetical protein [Brasilonema angustatum HA4187-MV1]
MDKTPDFLYRTNITLEKAEIHVHLRETFIPAFSELFAYISWKNFKEFGRGYLFVPIFAGKTPEEGFDVDYFPKDSPKFKTAKDSEIKSGQQVETASVYFDVDDYNPRYEYLIFIGWNQASDKATEHFFRITPEKAPYLVKKPKI